jgi:ankyrin repeat protein
MGANVNARDRFGWTALHISSQRDSDSHVAVAHTLLDTGAIVDTIDNRGKTPLHWALAKGRDNVARMLLDRGANILTVKLDEGIPSWVNLFIESRQRCRCVAIIIIGVHKYHCTNITGNNDNNVMRLIGKHIWSTRIDSVWVTPLSDT